MYHSAAAVGHRLTRVHEARIPRSDMGQPGSRDDECDHADEDAVVAACVVAPQEQADRVSHQDDRQCQGDPAERALDDGADAVAECSGDVPPLEGRDEDRQRDEREARPIAAGRLVGRLVRVEVPACPVAGHVSHSHPCAGEDVPTPGQPCRHRGPRRSGSRSVSACCHEAPGEAPPERGDVRARPFLAGEVVRVAMVPMVFPGDAVPSDQPDVGV